MKFSAHIEEWLLKKPFRISGVEWLDTRGLVVEVGADGCIGRGEAQGVYYLGETAESLFQQASQFAQDIPGDLTRESLQTLLPAGGVRNAIDCALWDLECKRQQKSIWELTGIEPQPVNTVFTIGIEPTPEAMAANAAAASDSPLLKVKLDSHLPYEKLAAIRAARPDAQLVVDANQGWSFELLTSLAPRLKKLDLTMIEQPLKRGEDEALEEFDSPIMLAADESCLDRTELKAAARRYGMINIKLDKTGGLTEALALAREARKLGCKLMVGNMMGTSLAMAPSFVVAQMCDLVDIDGPLLLKYDHPDGLEYRQGVASVFDSSFWG